MDTMDSRFPDWYYAAGVDPNDDFLKKRWQAVEEFGSQVTQAQALALVRVFYALPSLDQAVPEALEAVLQKHDAAFSARIRPQEMPLLAGALLVRILNIAPHIGDVAALAVASCHCCGVGAKGAVPEIVQIHRDHLTSRAAQQRHTASSSSILQEPALLSTQLAKAEAAGATLEAVKELIAVLRPVVAQLDRSVAAIAALAGEQRYFREESNVLWWMAAGCSRDLNTPFQNLGAAAAIVAGKELADMSASVVGPYASLAFLDKVLRAAGRKAVATVRLSVVMSEVDREWARGWACKPLPCDVQDFCPITQMLREAAKVPVEGVRSEQKAENIPGTELKIPAVDLARQVFEEALLAKAVQAAGGAM